MLVALRIGESEDWCCMQRNRRRKAKSKVTVVAPQVQQAYGGAPKTLQENLEGSYLTLLGVVFLIIMLEGIFIAVSVRLWKCKLKSFI